MKTSTLFYLSILSLALSYCSCSSDKERQAQYPSNPTNGQVYVDYKSYDGKYPIIGFWIIGRQSSGIGIRENSQRITDNVSYFVPHIIA